MLRCQDGGKHGILEGEGDDGTCHRHRRHAQEGAAQHVEMVPEGHRGVIVRHVSALPEWVCRFSSRTEHRGPVRSCRP